MWKNLSKWDKAFAYSRNMISKISEWFATPDEGVLLQLNTIEHIKIYNNHNLYK